jgi:hypothetical protein
MATTYKNISSNDVTSVRTRLHEAIPITGSIVSGTYINNNIKTYTHGMFDSVYDYPYLSSSANHIFDLTVGMSANDSNYSLVTIQQQKKNNLYNQFAQTLVGYDVTGSVRDFDRDGIMSTGSTLTSAIIMPFSRLLVKDEIKKGSFSMVLGVSASFANAFDQRIKVYDSGAINNYRVNSPAGEYGILYAENSAGTPMSGATIQAGGASPLEVGLIYYQAGVVLLDFITISTAGTTETGMLSASIASWSYGGETAPLIASGSTISTFCNDFRHRIYDISFNNTTELNSSIYFCRVNHNEYNYSANPTYLTGSKLRVKNNATDTPVAYFTTIGLYSADNELLATAKVSEPLKSDPSQNYTIRVRLDY